MLADSDKIKVLLIIHSLGVGGAEGQVYELVKRLDRSRYQPVVCSLTGGGAYIDQLRAEQIRVIVIANRLRQLPWRLNRLVKLIRQERFDIVQTMMLTAGVIGTILARTCQVPVVINQVRSLGFIHYRYRRPVKRILYKMSDCIVANSNEIHHHLIKHHLVEKSKVCTIYNGVDIDKFVPEENQSIVETGKRALGIPAGNCSLIGMIANLNPVKNHVCLLRAIPDILREVSNAFFLLIGSGPLRGQLEKLAQDLNIESHVLFLGERKDIADLLKLMDVCVLCSLREGFSNAILESMASGKPLIASNVGGNPEAVLDGKTGLLFESSNSQELAQKVIALLKNRDLREQMGVAARKRAENFFSTKSMVAQHEQLYASLLTRNVPSGKLVASIS